MSLGAHARQFRWIAADARKRSNFLECNALQEPTKHDGQLMLSLLLLLGAIPILSYRFARQRYPDRRFLIGGLGLGTVISPLSLGLYSLFSIPYVGLLPGMLGLALNMLHSAPGYNLALMTGIIPRGVVVEGISHVYLAAIDAVVWALVYGTVGWVLDRLLLKRNRASASLV